MKAFPGDYTDHNSRLGAKSRSLAIVGNPTVTKPASKLLIPVIHVTDVMTTAVVPFVASFGWTEATSVSVRRSLASDWVCSVAKEWVETLLGVAAGRATEAG